MQIGLILNKILIQAIWEIRAANVSPDTSKEIIMDSNALAEILNEALMDEYKARGTYQRIIDTFGPVRPFINIVEAEQTHIELLLPLYERYAVPLPPEPGPEWVSVPDSLLSACQLGVEEELANVAMYDRLS
jgi:hypothetical protein